MTQNAAEILVDGVSALADRYDGWIFDVWGTIYDGGAVFPGARDVLENLAARGVPVAVMSNSPRLTSVVEERLTGLGVARDLYKVVITSGGEARRYLTEGLDDFHAGLGDRVYTFAAARFGDILPGTRFTLVERLADADWILNAGPAGEFDQVELYEERLAEAAGLGLPMICANPDLAVFDQGRLKMHAGSMAARYEALGGSVHYHGKPHAPVFLRAAELLGAPGGRLIMVGDNRNTDIAGAEAAGMGSLLLADGIHHERLLRDGDLDRAGLAAFLAEPGAAPTHVAARLSW
ncbi:TIGR01459 family HAD-type hydrolase [Thalassobaculum sp. OXR-137]|uniref:TIGR01459 family HAD-type hydrolase n=1 Tax=Thalassobaculum sp. OXR-137 TaxID=3100173 RepID=UPI002AC95CA3|nr:TIGR01459 family HAD-type hydrolase [Thalassobaculum sp. OXR-137]WPZ36511.1 TIGR01459 family HAD-type hydrolase [Thalassobaculum sp. OXR-137]